MNTISSRLQLPPRSLLIVLALGLVVRTFFISLHERPLISDEREYDQLAYNIATRAIYAYGEIPTAYRPVGYPAMVGALYSVAGQHPLAVKFFQGFLDVTTAYLIYLLLAARSRRAAVLGALLWVAFPPAIFYTNFLMAETMFTFLLLLATALLVHGTQARSGFLIVLGISIGLLMLMKPGAVLLLLVPVGLYRRLQLSRRKVALIIGVALVVITPWVFRNWVTFGEPAISSNGGVNLLIGNHPGATGAYNLTFDPSILEGTGNEFEAEKRASYYAWKYIADHPATFAVNGVKKLAHFFESEGGILVWSFHAQPEAASIRFSIKYREIPLILSLVTNLPYMLLLLGGLLGFLAAKRDALWWIALLVGGIWLSIHLLFFAGSRFHFPLMTIAATYAALALISPLSTFKGLTLLQRVCWLTITVLLFALWTYEWYLVFNA